MRSSAGCRFIIVPFFFRLAYTGRTASVPSMREPLREPGISECSFVGLVVLQLNLFTHGADHELDDPDPIICRFDVFAGSV